MGREEAEKLLKAEEEYFGSLGYDEVLKRLASNQPARSIFRSCVR